MIMSGRHKDMNWDLRILAEVGRRKHENDPLVEAWLFPVGDASTGGAGVRVWGVKFGVQWWKK